MLFKRTIPLLIVFLLGLLGFMQHYVPHPWSSDLLTEMTTWFKIIGCFAMFLGVYSLLHMHLTRIRRKVQSWGYSVFVFIGVILMVVAGVVTEVQSSNQAVEVAAVGQKTSGAKTAPTTQKAATTQIATATQKAPATQIAAVSQKAAGTTRPAVGAHGAKAVKAVAAAPGASAGPFDWFDWGFTYIDVPAGATIFSILAFFMASAAFRTFRARNLAAGLLLISAVIVMLGRVPVSEMISRLLFAGHSQVIAHVTDVLMEYPNMVAKRGILLGIALAIISQSIRILLGIERSYMGGD